jgi:hypothetical protein
MTDPLTQLQRWCVEAVNKFGDDWSEIHLYVHEKLAELGEGDRIQFSELLLALGPEGENQSRYQS